MKKEDLLKVLPFALNTMAAIEQYNWDDEYCKKEVLQTNEKIRKYLDSIGFDFAEIDIETAELLGFAKSSDEDNIYLVPLWLYPVLPDGMILTSIFGDKIVVGKDNISNNEVGGCIAYGIEIK